jgi:hypothetical protein
MTSKEQEIYQDFYIQKHSLCESIEDINENTTEQEFIDLISWLCDLQERQKKLKRSE